MLTRVLVAINVVAFLWEQFTGAFDSDTGLIAHGALLGRAVMAGEWWRIFTAAFLHGGVMHILFNMFALWQVGSMVELIYGRVRMGILYFLAALGSGLVVTYFTPDDVTVGASGAIFGLFGALAVAGFRLGAPGRALMRQTVGIIIINLVLSYTLPNISKTGHIGGLIAGAIVGFILFRAPRLQPQPEPALVYARPIDPRSDPGVMTIEHPPLDEPTTRP